MVFTGWTTGSAWIQGDIWGSSSGLVLGNAGIFGAGFLLGIFPVAEVRPLPPGHRQQRCIVELLL